MKTDNELIAEFMGFIPEKSSLGNTWRHPDKMGVYGGVGMSFKYDTSWDWLMPVVEKIYRLEYDGVTYRGVKFTLKNSRAVIKDGKKTFTCHTISPLNSTYRVVVEFIKWYNSTLK